MTSPTPFGRYEARQEIGRGAMGIVYRAWDPKLHREVALKTLMLAPTATAEEQRQLWERFEREARAAGRLAHQHIVQVYDSGSDFIAMELVEGETLEAIMSRGPLPEGMALSILEQIAMALDFAHERGVIHRDVKPANVMVSHGGVAKVMDFGIARMAGATSSTARMMGTPRYMSPEQVSGEEIGAPADDFAFAEIAYDLLVGVQAFPGDSVAAILYRIANEDPPAPSLTNRALPRTVDPVFARALAKDPRHRHPRAVDFVRALRAALARPERTPFETQAATVLTASRSPLAGTMLRILVVPPIVVLAGLATLLLVMPEARTALFGTGVERPPAVAPPVVPAPSPVVTPTAASSPSVRSAEDGPTLDGEARPAPVPVSTPERSPSPTATERSIPTEPIPAAPSVPPRESSRSESRLTSADGLEGMRFFPAPFPGSGGAVVRGVEPGSSAWSAGIRPKDVITSWRGVPVAAPSDLAAVLGSEGVEVDVVLLREEGGAMETRRVHIAAGDEVAHPQIDLLGVRIEPDVRRDDRHGLVLHFSLAARGYAGRRLTAGAAIEDLDAPRAASIPEPGRVMAASPDAQSLAPDSDVWVSGARAIFVADDRLPRGPGEHAVRVAIAVTDESGRVLQASAPLLFTVSGTLD